MGEEQKPAVPVTITFSDHHIKALDWHLDPDLVAAVAQQLRDEVEHRFRKTLMYEHDDANRYLDHRHIEEEREAQRRAEARKILENDNAVRQMVTPKSNGYEPYYEFAMPDYNPQVARYGSRYGIETHVRRYKIRISDLAEALLETRHELAQAKAHLQHATAMPHTTMRVTSEAGAFVVKKENAHAIAAFAENAMRRADEAKDWATYDAMKGLLAASRKALK
jgi:hypothetical protein